LAFSVLVAGAGKCTFVTETVLVLRTLVFFSPIWQICMGEINELNWIEEWLPLLLTDQLAEKWHCGPPNGAAHHKQHPGMAHGAEVVHPRLLQVNDVERVFGVHAPEEGVHQVVAHQEVGKLLEK